MAVKTVFGAGSLRPDSGVPDASGVEEFLQVLKSHGVDQLDTARVYGTSETFLGQAGAPSRFTIDTKIGGNSLASAEELKASVDTSFKELGVDKVNILYFHFPHKTAPVENVLPAIDELHKAGKFSQFGLSNYLAADVDKIYDFCKAHGFVLPTVYQGNYNPLARRQETELLPTLRRLGIAFYAYSPIAGGFLAKTEQQIREGAGRFTEGSYYHGLYAANPAFVASLADWANIAAAAGAQPAELAYRWVAYNSALKEDLGDAIIVGARGVAQLKQSLAWLENGPLDGETAANIDEFWKKVQDQSPLDNLNRN